MNPRFRLPGAGDRGDVLAEGMRPRTGLRDRGGRVWWEVDDGTTSSLLTTRRSGLPVGGDDEPVETKQRRCASGSFLKTFKAIFVSHVRKTRPAVETGQPAQRPAEVSCVKSSAVAGIPVN